MYPNQASSRVSEPSIDAALLKRKTPRYPVAVTVDVLTLRSGSSANIPGRTMNLGEAGISAVLAGEFRPGEAVSVSFRLPSVGRPLHAEAVVRHGNGLHYGLEFVNAPREQQEMIRYWAASSQRARTAVPGQPQTQARATAHVRIELKRALALAALLLVTAGSFALLRWQRGWKELRAQAPVSADGPASPEVHLPGETMQKLLTHKVEPALPDAAQSGTFRGTVTLDAVIGKDGGVRDVHPVSGPEALAAAALDAVRWWRFEPYRIRGKAVEVETTLTVDFGPRS